jgi:hypothetical protein
MVLIKRLLALVFGFIFLDLLISIPLSELSNASLIRYSRLYNERIDADIVFAGNSRGVNSFYAPYFNEVTGLDSINLSYNGISIPLVKVFIDDYLERNDAPKVIFIETTCLNTSYKALPNFKQYIDNSVSIRNMTKEHFPSIFYSNLISKSFKFNSEYFLRTLYYLQKDDQTWINRYSISLDLYANLEPVDDFYMVQLVDSDSMNILKSMVVDYRNKGITVILVLAPIIDKYRNRENINSYLTDIKVQSDLDVVDLSDALSNIEMFADTVHTNEKGAHIIADILGNLPELYNLKN